MIELDPKYLDTVKTILRQIVPDARAWAFGSRASGAAKPFSDLDLALEGEEPLTSSELAQLKTAFSESDLPIKVDVVDLNSISAEFRKVIDGQKVRL
jgi:type I restriction enzyme S subunit